MREELAGNKACLEGPGHLQFPSSFLDKAAGGEAGLGARSPQEGC